MNGQIPFSVQIPFKELTWSFWEHEPNVYCRDVNVNVNKDDNITKKT